MSLEGYISRLLILTNLTFEIMPTKTVWQTNAFDNFILSKQNCCVQGNKTLTFLTGTLFLVVYSFLASLFTHSLYVFFTTLPVFVDKHKSHNFNHQSHVGQVIKSLTDSSNQTGTMQIVITHRVLAEIFFYRVNRLHMT